MIPEDIKKLRKALKLSQEGLARLLNISYNTVSHWERGKFKPSHMALEKLNKLLEQAKEANT